MKTLILFLVLSVTLFSQSNYWWVSGEDESAFVWTWGYDVNAMRIVGDHTAIEKYADGGSYNADAYSIEGFANTVTLQFIPSQADKSIMVGLNSDPQSSTGYESLDYAFFLINNGGLYVYESSTPTDLTTQYTASTILKITYDGTNIKYWKDGVVLRTVARAVGNALYIDGSYNELGGINSIIFNGN